MSLRGFSYSSLLGEIILYRLVSKWGISELIKKVSIWHRDISRGYTVALNLQIWYFSSHPHYSSTSSRRSAAWAESVRARSRVQCNKQAKLPVGCNLNADLLLKVQPGVIFDVAVVFYITVIPLAVSYFYHFSNLGCLCRGQIWRLWSSRPDWSTTVPPLCSLTPSSASRSKRNRLFSL